MVKKLGDQPCTSRLNRKVCCQQQIIQGVLTVESKKLLSSPSFIHFRFFVDLSCYRLCSDSPIKVSSRFLFVHTQAPTTFAPRKNTLGQEANKYIFICATSSVGHGRSVSFLSTKHLRMSFPRRETQEN